jgi:predicted dinucleotide-binding enzyme
VRPNGQCRAAHLPEFRNRPQIWKAWRRLANECDDGNVFPGRDGVGDGNIASPCGHDCAAAFGELLVLAVLGDAAEQAIAVAGPDNFSDKVLIDTTNPLDFSAGFPPKLSIGGEDSLGECVQRALP